MTTKPPRAPAATPLAGVGIGIGCGLGTTTGVLLFSWITKPKGGSA